MTRDEILAMKPGRELDALVAINIFGWQKVVFGGVVMIAPPQNDERMHWAANWDEHGCPHWIPHYSTDISAAWEVFEKIKNLGGWIEIAWNPKKKHYRCMVGANFSSGVLKSIDVSGFEEAPEAICKAALLAKLGGEME